MRSRTWFVVAVSVALVLSLGAFATPLDDYVKAPDSSYRYSVAKTIPGAGYTAYVLDMVSQNWRTKEEVDRTEWQHWLMVIKPDNVTANKALLWITGGSNGRSAPNNADLMLVSIALMSNSVVAELRMVPNQPLNFPDGGRPRSEDAIIAYTFDKYVKTGDATWPLLLPMVKSAVRAMDTVQDHIAKATEGKLKIEQFVVSGGSKRGWTTWLTAAVDKRVCAIAPAVIDVLNMDEQMRHHVAAYGFYSSAIDDYEEMKIFERLDTPQGQALTKFVDPYEYRDRYTMPKCLVNSSGDQFFLPDSSQFYFHDLPGEKYIRYCPNTDHGLGGSDAHETLLAFHKSVLAGAQRPRFNWTIKADGSIEVKTQTPPQAVALWQATNPKARDFRLETIGKVWTSTALTDQGGGTYVAKVDKPAEGWTAFFVELTFESGFGVPYKFTTDVKVLPETLPHQQKVGFDVDTDRELVDMAVVLSGDF